MKKLKVFWNFDKEERWLNEMAAQGQLISRAGLRYAFTPFSPSAGVVRVDYRPSMSEEDFADYVRLFHDAGWEHRAGTRRGGGQYFVSFSEEADADIFSDAESKAQRYRRSIAAHTALLIPLLVVVVLLWSNGSLLAAPQEWYVTPGLWDKQGAEFVGSFAFESLFVLFRVGGPMLLLGVCLYSLAAVIYQSTLYNRASAQSEPAI